MKLDDADGWLEIELDGQVHKLDLFQANDTFFYALDGLSPDAPGDYWTRLRKACSDLGLGEVSGRTAERVKKAVYARVEELRGKEPGPQSAD